MLHLYPVFLDFRQNNKFLKLNGQHSHSAEIMSGPSQTLGEMPSSALVSEIPVLEHSSGAGSIQTVLTRGLPPQSEATDSAPVMPDAKRRAVTPSPPPGVILPTNDSGGADKSLDISSDESMPGDILGRGRTPRATSWHHPGRPPRARALPSARGKTKRLPMSRSPSPHLPRSPIPKHELLMGCRAGGDQDTEARLRVL